MNIKKRVRVVPQDILDTNTNEGYFKYFHKLNDGTMRHHEIWFHIETTRQHYGLHGKFTSQESFKVQKAKHFGKS